MKQKLLIIGASGHGKVVADIAEKTLKYKEIAFLDDNSSVHSCMDFPVIGTSADIEKYQTDYECIVAIGNNFIRKKIYERLFQYDVSIATLIHPSVILAKEVCIGKGTVIMAGTIVNAGVQIGRGVILNTASTVDHDCNIGDYVHISPGCHLAGNVSVGERSWLGIGTIVKNNIKICEECQTGAGAVVVKNLKEKGIYVGVPAGEI